MSNRHLRALLGIAAVIAALFLASWTPTAVDAQPTPTSHPEITTEQTACDELTITVDVTISHPEAPSGTYSLVYGLLNDGLAPLEKEYPSGVATDTIEWVVDLPFDGDTFRAVLAIDGFNPADYPTDQLVIPAIDETCGSLTIRKDADGAGTREFDFHVEGQLPFDLGNDQETTFDGLEAGSIAVWEDPEDGWTLVAIICAGASVRDPDHEDGDVIVDLEEGEDATCLFVNEPVPASTATPAPTSTPAPTATPVILSSSMVTLCEGTTLVTRHNGAITGTIAGASQCQPTVIRITPPSTGDAGLLP